ncbi:MAG: hypothetical protein CMM92_04330 [Rickettsiales bacterium]|nr:hypothetical protein [Rickettsiales bacterium]RPG13999.1 MAG: penicillin-binding protein 2 [Pelagibacteraceae bacterium TMED195]|tara:strand:+ start:659 stop:2335 length:1677 start_codon:yes stop_codon:yes gene_type:complete
MQPTDKYIYENVFPSRNKNLSTNLKFKDENDLFNLEKKKDLVQHAKKINKYVLTLILFFFCLIIFNLQKFFVSNESFNSFSKSTKKERGKIFDRNGELIATNIDTKDFYIDPRKILDKNDLKKKLQNIFPYKKENYFENIFKKKQYIKIKPFITINEEKQLKRIGDPSINFHKSSKRIYLQHSLFSHLTGFKSLELKSKIERNLDEHLKEGTDISLTLDLRVQHKVHEELSKSLKLYNANSAVAIVMNVNNGEIISLVSLPDFNPNHPEDIQAFSENNLAFEARYEMGSTLKIFNAALVYENNSELEKKKFLIKNGYQITKDKLIIDEHIKKGELNFKEVFTQSSNVGSINIVEELGIEKQKELFQKLGINNQISLYGLNVVKNKLPKNWDSQASKFISYGYGMSISPISLVTSYAALVNGGYKIKPKVNLNENYSKEKILKDTTSKKINLLLSEIVKNGTAKKANVEGIKAGGKTGTSKKLENGEYSEKKVITSFIGAFPIDQPKYIAFVLFDEPRRNKSESLESFGGNTAAPTFSRILKKISPILNRNNYIKMNSE